MKKKYRNIYFWFIFLITITLIPVLLLYSSGYRFNFNKLELIKTGSLSIETIPKNVSIYINDQLYPKTTPFLINNLLPNEYKITLKKDGYSAWEKKIIIESTKTTFIKKAILYKNNTSPEKISKQSFPIFPPQETITTDIAEIINQLNLSSNLVIDKSHEPLLTILDKKDDTLYLIEDDNTSLKIEKISHPVKKFSWNKENNQLLYYNDIEIWVYNYEEGAEELITRQSETIEEAIWLNNSYVIYNEKNKIKLLELDNRDYRQCDELVQVNNAYNLSLDKKQKNLFWQTVDNYWMLNLFD